MEVLVGAAIAVAIFAIVLFALYLAAARRESGLTPSYAEEAYFYSGARAPAEFRARPASPAEVARRAASGGALPPSPSTEAGPGGSPAGAWLYGPKPRVGTEGVAPFGAGPGAWFEEATTRGGRGI